MAKKVLQADPSRLGAELDLKHFRRNGLGGWTAETEDGHIWITEESVSPYATVAKLRENLPVTVWIHAKGICSVCQGDG